MNIIKQLYFPTDEKSPLKEKWDSVCYNAWRALPYSWRDAYYKVRDFFFPRHRWLTDKIPNSWVDKHRIIEISLFESLKHYVDPEGEDCFGMLASGDECHEPQRTFMKEVRDNYNLITQTIPALEKQLEAEWAKLPPWGDDILEEMKNRATTYQEHYGEIDRLEREISDLKTKVMVWIVTNREGIWT